MAGRWSPGTPPPEVPEEFAAAYRAAYERAMAAQAAAPPGVHADREHAEPAQEEPEREPDEDEPDEDEPDEHEPPEDSVGFFDSSEVEEVVSVGAPTVFGRVRDSGWLVPLLLLLLAVLLVAAAYAVGRVFSGRVADADSSPQVVHAVAPAALSGDHGDPSPFGRISL